MSLPKGTVLKTEDIAKFIGNDLEYKNPGKEYIFRGPIKKAIIEGDTLTVELEWTARGLGYPPDPKQWVRANNYTYKVDLNRIQILTNDSELLSMQAPVEGELITFYGPGKKLEPKAVAGLELTEENN